MFGRIYLYVSYSRTVSSKVKTNTFNILNGLKGELPNLKNKYYQ